MIILVWCVQAQHQAVLTGLVLPTVDTDRWLRLTQKIIEVNKIDEA